MQPLVSILIPAYNAEKWISDSIQSALAQTYPNKEIIIVDDGSSDRTLEIAGSFASDRVKVVTQKNQGAAAARNKAYSLCRGDYIQWLDADDLLSPDKIFNQMKAAEQAHDTYVLFSCGWGRFYYRPNSAKFIPNALWSDLPPVEWLLRKFEGNGYLAMQTATWLVSRELTEAVGPWNTELLGDDDGEYFCRAVVRSHAIRFVPEAKVFQRNTDSNRLSYIGKSKKKLDAQIRGMRLQINYLRAVKDDERARAACVAYVQAWLPYFYPNYPEVVTEMEQLAHSLGGKLKTPKLSWKYVWIQKILGWQTATSIQMKYNQLKNKFLKTCDKIIWQLETRSRLFSPNHSRHAN
jgi:glycosyltransferase involved in cell wall biosynthesis